MLQFLTNDIPKESPGDAAVMGGRGARQEPVGGPKALTPWGLLPGDPGWGGTLHRPSLPLAISRAWRVSQGCLRHAGHPGSSPWVGKAT